MAEQVTVIYSIGSKFAGGGIGTTAYHAVRGLHHHDMLKRLFCGAYQPTEIPQEKIRALGLPDRALRKLASLDSSGWLWHLQAVLFDTWASRRLEPANVFHVWGNYGLRSLRRAREMGTVTVVERASAHPVYQTRLLKEEFARWGLSFHAPQATTVRAIAEMAVADYILIPSEFVRQSFLGEGFPAEKLIQVPFGVDTARFRPSEVPAAHPFRALFVGQVGIRKGVPYLLEAWRQLGWRDAELWLVGRALPECQLILRRYEDLPGLRLIGHLDNPVEAYRQADVFAFPSIEEGSALVTYEALACGLPVVATPNAGSVVRDGVEGFIVPIRNVEALANALERLRADKRLRQEMGRAARERAREFTWERYGDKLANSLRQAADRRRGP
ncbi:MAG: glycosyltransferase family 4 protein [Chloroflexi bacterium]|nr:glycosyltransferase family 4 protein [Chloroflexota bacterium]